MATKTYTFSQWLKLVVKHAADNGFQNVAGYPVADAAKKLEVSPSRIAQLIAEDVLDTLEVTTVAGRVAIRLVTEASIERYLELRVPDRNRQGYFAFQE